MKHHPSISIAIPTYNEERNIAKCLSSIFNQRYRGRLEIFIIDGGSTDKTIRMAKRYSVQIINNPQKTAEYGTKLGLMRATGKYFMILGADMTLVGDRWFEKMVQPLEEHKTIMGSWTRFISSPNDTPITRYITLDPIQRDPLFIYLTPSIESCVSRKTKNYWIIKYSKNKILPAGFCLYRREEILKTEIRTRKKYMELDNLAMLVANGRNTFAYVPSIGFHHPFLVSLRDAIRKRQRNLATMYFNQPDKRYWTWIEWDNPLHLLKIFFWVIYCYTLFPCFIVGLYKSIKHHTWVGFYELPFNIITTSAIIISFLNQAGKNLIYRNEN